MILLGAVLAGACVRRPLVRHQLLLRRRRPQRAGHLPGPDRRVPLVQPGRGASAPASPPPTCPPVPRPAQGRGRGVLGGQCPSYVAQPGDDQAAARPIRRRRSAPSPGPTTTATADHDHRGHRATDHHRRRPDGTADPTARDLHGAVLRGPVHPAQQHPGAQGQLAGQQPGQPAGASGRAQPDPRAASSPPTACPWPRRSWPRRTASTSTSGCTTPTPPRSSPRSSGSTPSSYGNFRGVESQYNSYLTPHTRPAKTLRDLLVNRTVVDNVTLTVNTNLQTQVAAALDQHAPGVLGAAAVVLNPTTGAIEAMYSNPTFDPNPLVSQDLAKETAAWNAYACPPQRPRRPAPREPARPRHLRPGSIPRVDLQGGDHVGRARAPARPGHDDLPDVSHRSPCPTRAPRPRS